ncbi:MAG: DNA polymerase III subunit gamma/tau [Rhizobiales bacterium]|nr:DNA polymerase III subunit gamma/tau [Hyphomicrobiales bacterium]
MDGGDLSSTPKDGATGAYRVLARKYRPRSFDDLVGQEPMVRTLKNAFETGRIAQAYMLTGVRGVGKTTTARILARGLNYSVPGKVDRPTIDMPELGVHCAEIMEGRHVDVLEMDAASNNGIDNIREIIEAVRYKPVSARYKVYILDEVHMLSGAAFNGLLKTLEEPPEHVKFIFATTEIRKVPVTVLSRCQRFDLRRIESDRLIGLLRSITDKEHVEIGDDALAMIARAAEGSARDSLSLLDQAIAHGAGAITAEDVRGMLGLADRARVIDLFEALMGGRIAEALALLKEQYDIGADPAVVLQDLAAFTHAVTRFKVVPDSGEDAALPQDERTRGRALAGTVSLRVLARAWQMLLKGIEEVSSSSRPLAAADMVLIRIAHAADLPTPDEALRLLKSGQFGAASSAGGATPQVSYQPASAPQASGGSNGGPIGQMRTITNTAAMPAAASMAQPAGVPQAKAEPAIRFQRFEDLVAYVGLKRDIPLKLAQDLGRKLSDWTGERWVVALGRGATEPTIAEARAFARDKARSDAAADPLVAAVLSRFPGAKIVDIQIRGAEEPEGLPSPAVPVDNPDEAPDPDDD